MEMQNLHAAIKAIDLDGLSGFDDAQELVGLEVALAILTTVFRKNLNEKRPHAIVMTAAPDRIVSKRVPLVQLALSSVG